MTRKTLRRCGAVVRAFGPAQCRHDHPTRPRAREDDATLIAASRDEPERFAELYDRHAAAIQRMDLLALIGRMPDGT
ncbi:hypothetical protein GCM10023196_082580 [Actinoallomurus vinaceus]|uniref:DUF5753 domain-containing protein n=1 Tax=Actinoallomurus vinaceus TaxID=1080074 RepID=A0ABP8UPY4_9ACTN